jgi:hypothetical protein
MKWTYSWMQDLETTTRPKVSKALLLEWLVSNDVEKAVGKTNTPTVPRAIQEESNEEEPPCCPSRTRPTAL